MIRAAALAAAGLACALAAAPAVADPEVAPGADADAQARAKQLFTSASTAYDLRDYANAIDQFKKAYALLPEPLFLFDIAQSYRQLHACDDARSFYRSYLRNAPDAENRAKVEAFIDEMDRCLAEAHAGGAGGNVIVVARPPDPHGPLRLAGLITAAAGVALVGVGVFFAIDASNQASDLEAACQHGCTASDVDPIDQAGHNAQTGAIVTFVLGGAALAAGIGMYVWARRVEPVVAPATGGATVSARVSF